MNSNTRRPCPRGTRFLPIIPVTAAVMLLAVLTSPRATWANETYYVDAQCPTCSVAGPGTEAEPFCSITSALRLQKGPGITILVKPGVYREQVTINASGTATAPFVIRATGPGVVMEGSDDLSGEERWQQPGEATLPGSHEPRVLDYAWVAPEVTWEPQQVFVAGRRLTHSQSEPGQLVPGSYTWVEGEGLYVNTGSDNPGGREILVGRRGSAFRVSGMSWVVIEGFEVLRADNSGIIVYPGSADVLIARNQVTYSESYGIKVSGSQRVRVEENVVTDGAFHGIGLTSGSIGCVVQGNESARNAHPSVRMAKGIYVAASPNNTLAGNRTHDNQDSGIQLNPGSDYCLLFNNQSWRNGDHGFDHLDAVGPIHVNEVAYGNHMDGFSIEGNSPGGQIFNCISFDNGLTTQRFNLWVNVASAVGFRADHNIFWSSVAQEPFKFGLKKYLWLTDYQTDSGQDPHSFQADPQLLNPAEGYFAPMAGSPAIDAGTSAAPFWPPLDYAGNPRYDDPATPDQGGGPIKFSDIGAFEYVKPAEEGPVELVPPNLASADRLHGPMGAGGVADPRGMTLSGAFPNPSHGPVAFALEVKEPTDVEWTIFDLQGRAVWTERQTLAAGNTQLRWDGYTSAGVPAATGVYLVQARAAGIQLTRRLIRI